MGARYNPLHWLGIFIMAALMEFAGTGNWRQANKKSAAMGKSFERPIWWLRSLGGLLPIAPPEH